ncbi:MAG: DNA-3-methyladenine glycosylase [candidate division Zixibacteria bacterium]|nr:DNA-3-methyladenine glycosylase [candidate division Zixibacteria bacterium]
MKSAGIKKLKREFYNRPTLEVAKELLGKYLVVNKNGTKLSGKIVETEAYRGLYDPASHAYGGMTPRNRIMFGEPGYAYVYFTYGMYYCLNVITERKGFPAGVLIRALEPKNGIEIMRKKRKKEKIEDLTSGPGKLCQAMGVDKSLNGADLIGKTIYVEDRNEAVGKIVSTNRIGIDEGKEKKWRFYLRDNRFVSRS